MKYSCYYIICFGCLMGFTIYFYTIFGTNLLTGGPAQIVVFLPISVFRRKEISNGVQTEWNLRESYFWNKRNPGDLEWMSRKKRGGHEAGPSSWAPGSSKTYFFLLYIPIYSENIQEHNRSGVPPPEASVATKNQSRPVPAPCRRGGIPLRWPSSSSRCSSWRGGSSSPSRAEVMYQ